MRSSRNPVRLADIERVAASDEWEDTPERVKSRYVQILRTIARKGPGTLPATKERAKRVLAEKGYPLKPPSPDRGPSHRDAMERKAREARFRGIVRRQREALMIELKAQPVVTIDDGPASRVQAAEDLVKIGEAVMLADEMVRFPRGNCKAGEIKRRVRRVMRICAPETMEDEQI